jgi:tRNA dimethylallyltransferase
MKPIFNLITILGPTASGKTLLATHVAKKLNSAVISADSRQIYKGMNIGTGKDLGDFNIDSVKVPYYLIDIVDAGTKYNVFEYQKDFFKVFNTLVSENKVPVLCGGSGLYIEAVLKGYKMLTVPVNDELRIKLGKKSDSKLVEILSKLRKLHNTTDTITRKRLIRAIEIEQFHKNHHAEKSGYPNIQSLVIGVKFEREKQKERITQRLQNRLNEGLVDEVNTLLKKGISPENLIYYGLEYKFITLYITGKIDYETMFNQLNIAIHQFAKRQMTWFRKMEREGIKINWIDGDMSLEKKIQKVFELIYN